MFIIFNNFIYSTYFFLKIKFNKSQTNDVILKNVGLIQKYLLHFLKIKSKKLKNIFGFLFNFHHKKKAILLKKERIKLINKANILKNILFISFLLFIIFYYLLYIK